VDPAAPLASPTLPPTSTPDPWAALGAPARITIPDIGVDAPLEQLALRGDQKIAVPEEWDHAGWYETGFRPGEPGSAVVSGHFDDDKGAPAVFYELAKVQVGAEIIVAYPDGERYKFRVDRTDLVDATSVDREVYDSIFGPAGEARLSLVTCDGAWDADRGGYDKRFIVHAVLDADAIE
jgi:sortase (surface protein transpeptidase)